MDRDRSEVDAVRARTDIVDLISGYTALKRAGSKYKGLCPFHQEKTPSFNVDPALGTWHCFGACGTGGDAFAFLMKAENLTFPETLQRLADRAGITLAPRGADTPERREAARRALDERERVFAANASALRFFRQCYKRDKAPQEYAAKRGLVHETLENFQIGWAPDDWSQLAGWLYREKIPHADAEAAGLIMPSRSGDGSYTDRFRGRLIFPIFDVQERVIAFGGRIIGDTGAQRSTLAPDAPKYLNSPESPVFLKKQVLYGLNRARKAIANPKTNHDGAARVLVVEGYMDVVAAHQAGIENVVATLGTAMTEDHVHLIRKYGATEVVLSFDADEAGVKAALRAADIIANTGADMALRVLSLPAGEDPDSLLRKGEAASFRRAIDEALTVPEFRINAMQKRADLRTDAGRAAFLREAVEIIAAVPLQTEQDRLIRRVSGYHLSSSLHAEESLRADVRRVAQRRNGQPADDGFGGTLNSYGQQGYGNRSPWRGNNGGNYNGNGGGNGNGFRRNGYGPQRPFVAPDPIGLQPASVTRSAAAEAERTLLRALLSDEWASALVRSLGEAPMPVLTRDEDARIVAALIPRITVGVAPSAALQEMEDKLLAGFALAIRMEESGPDLNEAVIEDALRRLQTFRSQREMEQIRARMAPNREGNAASDDELLRQWSERARMLKRGGTVPDSGEDE